MAKPEMENFLDLPLQLLAKTENPAHRAMILNFTRHELLEVAGHWREVVKPHMTVRHPVYHISVGKEHYILDGMDAVSERYADLFDTNASILWPTKGGFISVSDWGVAAERTINWQMNAQEFEALGEKAEPGRTYVVQMTYAHIFPYRNGLLYGENIYEQGGSRKISLVAPEDVATVDDVRAAAMAALAKLPER